MLVKILTTYSTKKKQFKKYVVAFRVNNIEYKKVFKIINSPKLTRKDIYRSTH